MTLISGATSLTTVLSQIIRQTATQQVIAQNVANASNPGYKALVAQQSSSAGAIEAHNLLKRTSHRHIGGSGLIGGVKFVVDSEAQVKPNGNTVDLDRQMQNMAQCITAYKGLLEILTKSFQLYNSASSGYSE